MINFLANKIHDQPPKAKDKAKEKSLKISKQRRHMINRLFIAYVTFPSQIILGEFIDL